jgi:hypothetical protein
MPRFVWNDVRDDRLKLLAATHIAEEIRQELGADTVRTIYKRARTLNIDLMGGGRGGPSLLVDLSGAEFQVLMRAAVKRGFDRQEALQKAVQALLSDPVLLANVFDDGVPE